MTNDGTYEYQFDAEGHITEVLTEGGATVATYGYNGLNQRELTTVGGVSTEFVFNAAGQRVSVVSGATNSALRGQYYWGGKPVAFYTTGTGAATHFQHQDWLGTERLRTTYNGAVEGSYISLPWGDGYSASGSDLDPYHYAMLDHDSESDTEHAQFRQYSSAQGHWLSPDPYGGSYDISNPQSFNRYVYALNNPLSFVDPRGLTIPICDAVDVTVPNSDGSYGFTVYEITYCLDSGGWGGGVTGVSVGGGGGGGGGKAPSKNVFGVTPQQQKACQDAWNNSALGKGVQFFSLYNLATNLSSLKTWAEWTVLPAAKVGALSVLSKISSAVGGTEISSVVAGTTTTVTAAPVASGIAASESVGASAAPYGIAAATVLDMNASAGCMGMQSNYFSSGQVGVF